MARMKLRMGSFGGIANRGDIVTDASGVSWICTRATSSQPGTDLDAWQPVAIRDPAFDVEGPQGPPGESIKGDKGDPGRDGANGVDGRGLDWRGEWKRRTAYSENDVVEHDGSSWICTADTTRNEPTENSRHWQLMAAKGADGRDGETGATGARGRAIRVDVDGSTAKAWFDSAAVRGNAVYASSDGHVDLASAAPDTGGAGHMNVVGLVKAATPENAYGDYVTNGPFVCDSWNWEPNKMVYLSPDVPGGLTQTYPDNDGEFVVLIGQAVTPTGIILNPHYFGEN